MSKKVLMFNLVASMLVGLMSFLLLYHVNIEKTKETSEGFLQYAMRVVAIGSIANILMLATLYVLCLYTPVIVSFGATIKRKMEKL